MLEYSVTEASPPEGHAKSWIIHVCPAEAERLLLEWVNLPFEAKQAAEIGRVQDERERMHKRYPDVFGAFDDTQFFEVLIQIQKSLQKAWSSAELGSKEWYFVEARNLYRELPIIFAPQDHPYQAFYGDIDSNDDLQLQSRVNLLRRGGQLFSEPPPSTPFDVAVSYFQRTLADRAKYCGDTLSQRPLMP
jgi:hypothetical protein